MARILSALLLVSFSLATAQSVRARPLIQGHRGARAKRPENTLSGFRYAIEAGADILEMDVHVTKDDVLVVTHDPYVNPALCRWRDGRRVKARIAIRKSTHAALRRLDCGGLKNPRFPAQKLVPGAHMPTLEKVLRATKARRSRRGKLMRFNIETKIVPASPLLSTSPGRFARLLFEMLKMHRLLARTTVQSFDARTLESMRKLSSKIDLALLTDGNYVDYALLARRHKVNVISPNHRWILRRDVERLRGAKIRVAPWTANTADSWMRLTKIGVSSIITDDPGALFRYLEKRPSR